MQALKNNPEVPFGIHLTVICDPAHYRWGPLTCREKVPSLVDEAGYFYSYERMPEFLAHVRLGELEAEFRAQIDTVLATGLRPTHLDWHSLRGDGMTTIFQLMLRLAKDYGLALRAVGRTWIEQLQRQGLPTNDHDFLDSFGLEPVDRAASYAHLLHDLLDGQNSVVAGIPLDQPLESIAQADHFHAMVNGLNRNGTDDAVDSRRGPTTDRATTGADLPLTAISSSSPNS